MADLFAYIPKSFVAKDLKIPYHTLLSKIENPKSFYTWSTDWFGRSYWNRPNGFDSNGYSSKIDGQKT